MRKRSNSRGTKISQHLRSGKILKSKLSSLQGVTLSSWRDDRLPKVLWASLLTAQMDRDKYLEIFRDISSNCAEYPDIDWRGLGHSRLARLSDSQFDRILSPILNEEVLPLLKPLGLFQEIPDAHHWSRHLKDWSNTSKENYDVVAVAVGLNSWHQSETATDIRWLRVLSLVQAEKMIFPDKLDDKKREIVDFPHYGIMQKVRPSIRAAEQAFVNYEESQEDPAEWLNIFWRQCKQDTSCWRSAPKNPDKISADQVFKQAISIYRLLVKHFHSQESFNAVDARLDGVFGIALYSLNMFITLLSGNSSRRIEGRILLRCLCENYITLSYLLHMDSDKIWIQYRNYGLGQAKLAYLKYLDIPEDKLPSFVSANDLEELANEDRWMEFVDIDLGSWAGSNLRKMSEDAGVKDFYDKHYDWTSGFVHGHWTAVRDTVFDQCLNPLHRLHRIPSLPRVGMGDAVPDATKIINAILDRVNSAYPTFKTRIRPNK